MTGSRPDLSGLATILKDYPGVVERIGDKLAAGVAPSTKDAGHLEDEATAAMVDGLTRRKALLFALVGVAAGALNADTYKAFSEKRKGDTSSQSGPIRREFLNDLISREYGDEVFSAPIAWKNPTADERALHDSHYLLRRKKFDELGSNLPRLKKALKRATDPDTRAFVAQRLVIDNNALGHGLNSAHYAAELKSYAPDDVSADVRTNINGRSIDVICTSTLNTMPRENFLQFRALDTGELERRYQALGIHMRQPADAMIRQSLQGFNASIYAVIQSKWMRELQRVDPKTSGYLAILNKIRHDWFEEVYAVANGLARHKNAKDIAEDFFYTICRIAFHAYACGDLGHLSKILQVYFVGRPTMKAHLASARPEVIKRSAPNIQWVKMLSVRAANHPGADHRSFAAAGTARYEAVKAEMGRPANAVIERALAELGAGHPAHNLVIDSPFSTINRVPTVYNQVSYFDIVVNGLH